MPKRIAPAPDDGGDDGAKGMRAAGASSKLRSVTVTPGYALELPRVVEEADRDIQRLLASVDIKMPTREDGEPVRMLQTTVTAETEEVHLAKAFNSRGYTFPFHAASVAAAAIAIIFCIRAIYAAFAVFYLGPIRFHFLGYQLTWNTQEYGVVYTARLVPAMSSALFLYIVYDGAAAGWKVWQWLTRSRDVGYNICTRRVKIAFGFKVGRLPFLAGIASMAALFSTWPIPSIVDTSYYATCKLNAAFGRDPSDMALEGVTSGECVAVLSAPAVIESERSYRGEVPDTDPDVITRFGGGNVTVYMPPYGRELGCPLISQLYPQYTSDPGGLLAAWTPLTSRPLRRCLSQKGYVFSNWFTFAPSCDALGYLRWVNSTRVIAFGHAEQWFCGVYSTQNATHLTVHYNTTGWLSSTTGASCLTRNDSAAAVGVSTAGPYAGAWPASVTAALASVRGTAVTGNPATGLREASVGGLLPGRDLPQAIFPGGSFGSAAAGSSASDNSTGGGGGPQAVLDSGWSPVDEGDSCESAQYGCLVRDGYDNSSGTQYLRALSLSGCKRVVAKPMSTQAYTAALSQDQERWGAALLQVVWVVIAESVVEWLETILTCLFF